MESRHQYKMGIVGNCAYLAYIDTSGRVVWLCWPRPDSSFAFGHLLDHDKGGELSLMGMNKTESLGQRYIRNTNVLETDIETDDGAFRITDCAPRFILYERNFKPLIFVRKIEPLRGNPRIKVICRPRADYGQQTPRIYQESNHIRYDFGIERIRLNANIPLSYIGSEQPFVLNETKYIVVTWGVPLEAPLEATAEEYLRETIAYWRSWVRQCAIGPFYQTEIIRSGLVLKLHQYEDTGAIIASGTTSLPEYPNTGRNWDYRYCWLRDAYYTLNALNHLSQFDEMQRFAQFIENIAANELSRLPPVVKIDGTLEIPERFIELAGYDGTNSVRVGNQAFSHIQNDVYGQIVFATLHLYIDERLALPVKGTARHLILLLLNKIDATLDECDATLWEFRGRSMRHCYTSLFHWVGAKAAAKIARHIGDRDMLRLATRLISRSAKKVEECFDPSIGAYAQEPGSRNMDASLLQLITLQFLDPRSDRARSHLAALEAQLKTPDGLFYRYIHQDDFGTPKSTFLVCSFWYVEALALMGNVNDAIKHLDKLLQFTNHLGLLSEDVESSTGSQWGNFPQTYSHVGLMNAIFRITSEMRHPEFF